MKIQPSPLQCQCGELTVMLYTCICICIYITVMLYTCICIYIYIYIYVDKEHSMFTCYHNNRQSWSTMWSYHKKLTFRFKLCQNSLLLLSFYSWKDFSLEKWNTNSKEYLWEIQLTDWSTAWEQSKLFFVVSTKPSLAQFISLFTTGK